MVSKPYLSIYERTQTTQLRIKHIHLSMSWVRLEPMTPMSKGLQTEHPSDSAVLQTGVKVLKITCVCSLNYSARLDDWLTMHRSITLVDLQLDAQNSYLFTYNTFIKILYILRALPCSSSGGLRRNCTYAAAGIVTVCS